VNAAEVGGYLSAAAAALFGGASLQAAPGDLDTTFGGNEHAAAGFDDLSFHLLSFFICEPADARFGSGS
jgi:hypothetical protein